MARLDILTGDYGSGKTEISINYALQLAAEGEFDKVALVDLDIVNPYFRSREAARELTEEGIEVIFPTGEVAHADLPVITPLVYKVLQDKRYKAIFDVGGDEVGARVLGSLREYFKADGYKMALVVNNNRPFTNTPEGVRAMKESIERASRLEITALIANPNLGGATDARMIQEGHEEIAGYAEGLDLPLLFTAVGREFIGQVDIGGKILPLQRYMKQPW